MVLIGEFLQLQPVPNLFDEGRFMFYSPVFDFAIAQFDLRGPRVAKRKCGWQIAV